jgi:thiol:disulfide interchange protein DsbC
MKKLLATFAATIATTAALAITPIVEVDNSFPEIEKLGFPISKAVNMNEPGFKNLYFIKVGKDWVIASKESNLVIKGEVIDLSKRELVTSRFLAPVNKEIVEKFPEELKIVYKSTAPQTSGVINVLTDTSCPFCTKLHKEIPALNKAGIEVRYIPFARGYTKGAGYKQMLSAWCSDDKNKALDDMFAGKKNDPSRCLTQAVKRGYELATELGATGTPAIYFSNGEENSGYAPARILIKKNASLTK